MTNRLAGKVALVAGATRGAGRAIAAALGAAGARVYATGRSVRGAPSDLGRAETIDETAALIQRAGGTAAAVQVDHTQHEQVKSLIERVRAEAGRLDILINDVWGGDRLVEWDTPFYEHHLPNGLAMIERGVFTHIITSVYAAPLMIETGGGLIIEVTDGNTPDYRGSLYYDFVKSGVIRLALAQAAELKDKGIAVVALTPGFLRSEAMLEHFGVTEANWRDGIAKDPYFAESETPYFIGQAVVALAGDDHSMTKTGKALATWDLAEEYGFTDYDGRRPHWRRFYAAMTGKNP